MKRSNWYKTFITYAQNNTLAKIIPAKLKQKDYMQEYFSRWYQNNREEKLKANREYQKNLSPEKKKRTMRRSAKLRKARYKRDPEFRRQVIEWSKEHRKRSKLRKLTGVLSELPTRPNDDYTFACTVDCDPFVFCF